MRTSIKRSASVLAITGLLAAGVASAQTPPPPSASSQGQELQVNLQTRRFEQVERAVVQGQKFATGPNETLEILLADGASIVLASSTTLEIVDFAFNRETGEGQLRIAVTDGASRIMTGRATVSKAADINVGGVPVALTNGGVFVTVDRDASRIALLAGGPASIACRNAQTLTRVGFETTTRGGACQGAPKRQSAGSAFADAVRVNPGLGATRGGEILLADASGRGDDQETTETARPPTPDFPNPGGRPGAPGSRIGIGPQLGAGLDPGNRDPGIGNSGFAQFLAATATPVDTDYTSNRNSQPFQRRLPVSGASSYQLAGQPRGILNSQARAASFAILADRVYDPSIEASIDELTGDFFGACQPTEPPCSNGELDEVREYIEYLKKIDNYLLVYDPNAAVARFENASGFNPTTLAPWQAVLRLRKDNIFERNGLLQLLSSGQADTISFSANRSEVPASSSPLNFPFIALTPTATRLLSAGLTSTAAPFSAPHFLALEWDQGGSTFFIANGLVGPARASATNRIDTYNLTRGLTAADFTAGSPNAAISGFRAFLPGSGATGPSGPAYVSTPLWVVNGAGADQNALLQADFAMSADGRASGVSATFGQLRYENGNVSVAAQTVGSERTSGGAGSTLLTSPLYVSAAGGGNPNLKRAGAPGYLVLENATAAAGATSGGTVNPVAGPAEQGFAYLRLATADAGSSQLRTDPIKGESTGYVSGLLENESASGATSTVTPFKSTLKLTPLPSTNTLTATLDGPDVKLSLGGAGRSALIDDNRFAAGDTNSAIVSGPTVFGGLTAAQKASFSNSANGVYAHLQWGFFFGDAMAANQRNAHLASWVTAQKINTQAADYRVAGTATYKGHALGNVVNNGQSYVGFGNFEQVWDLSGGDVNKMTLAFDGRNYFNTPGLTLNSDLSYSGFLTDMERSYIAFGDFNGNLAGGLTNSKPNASIGEFRLNFGGYTAAGTFGGALTGGN